MGYTYKEMMQISKDFYDTIDFKKFMEEHKLTCYSIDLDTLIEKLETYYDDENPSLLPKEFQGCFFNFMNKDEFAAYLKLRYDWQIDHEFVSKYYIIS